MVSASTHSNLMTLARWMASEFSNQRQALAQPQKFAHIRVFFRPLPFAFFGGIGFYSEQVYDYDLWSPYRQGAHRLVDRGDHVYVENYGFCDPVLYAGAGRDRQILLSISPDDLIQRCNCAMIFRRQGDRFIGEVEGQQCCIPKRGRLTYLVSEVELTESTWNSRDRGFDTQTHEQVWGSEHGSLQFEKQQDFSQELCEAPS